MRTILLHDKIHGLDRFKFLDVGLIPLLGMLKEPED